MKQSVIETIEIAKANVGKPNLSGFIARLILEGMDDQSEGFREEVLRDIYDLGFSTLFDDFYYFDEDIIEFWDIYEDELLGILNANSVEFGIKPEGLQNPHSSVHATLDLIRVALDYLFEVEYNS